MEVFTFCISHLHVTLNGQMFPTDLCVVFTHRHSINLPSFFTVLNFFADQYVNIALGKIRSISHVFITRTIMHSSRMRTIRCTGHLSCHACPPSCTAPLSHMPAPAMHAPPWTEFLTHDCEHITFPQLLLRTVMIFLALLRYIILSINLGAN